jgi:hypothetical protein
MNVKLSMLSSLLLLCCQTFLVNAADALPEQAAAKSTVTTEPKLQVKENSVSTPTGTAVKTLPAAAKASSSEDIKDPTNMNENFRAALNRADRRTPINNANPNVPIPVVPPPPTIKLLATACEHHKEKNHAMLSVNGGKSEMVGIGDKITAVVNNQITQIEVINIEKNHVHIRLQPSNETLILR